jgi:uncharacterized protein (TIGR02145 family)
LSKGTSININSAMGGTITTNNNAQVTFPVNAFTTLSGIPFNGDVRVFTHHISPDDSMFSLITPGGDLAALNQNNELSQLISYGMTGVLIEDINGNKLEIAPGKTAELKMPIAVSQIADAPADIPLFYFNTEKGIWVKEGTAIRLGNEFIGSVSHFSWWNCDIITTTSPMITGRVVDCQGAPLANIAVTANNQFTVYTNNQGVYLNWVPQGITLTLQVLASFNPGVATNSNSITILPGPGTNNIPDLIVSCPTWISGQAKCNGDSAAVYVWSSWIGGTGHMIYSPGGTFRIKVPSNENVSVFIANNQNNVVNNLLSGPMASTININPVNICDTNQVSGCGGVSVVQDIDGNSYNVIQIGNNCWMKENLKVKRYSNGDSIVTGLNNAQWSNTYTGAYSLNDTTSLITYLPHTVLYSWFAVTDTRNVCPTGWHSSTLSEWNQMIATLDINADTLDNIPSLIAGGRLKATGNLTLANGLWYTPNTGANNISDFSAVPSGRRDGSWGIYLTGDAANKYAYFWTANPEVQTNTGIFFELSWDNTYLRKHTISKRTGFPVRCVMD